MHSASGDEDGIQRVREKEKSSLYFIGTKQGFLQNGATTPNVRKMTIFEAIFVKKGFAYIPSDSRKKIKGWAGNKSGWLTLNIFN